MNEWLDVATKKLAAATGDDATFYELTADEQRALLELARVAAHESGARINAPLATFLAGVARGRHPDRPLADLLAELG
jgi:hypothetical protein